MGYRTTDQKGVEGPSSSVNTAVATFVGTSGEEIQSNTTLTYNGVQLNLAAAGANIQIQESGTGPTASPNKGYIWVRNDTPNTLIFTDDDGTDFPVAKINGTANTNYVMVSNDATNTGDIKASTVRATVQGQLAIVSGTDSSFRIFERSTSPTFAASYGDIWVRNDTPNTLIFTDDAGTDHPVATSTDSNTASRLAYYTTTNAEELTSDVNFGYQSGLLFLNAASSAVRIAEGASAPTVNAGQGGLWVKDDTPSALIFTNDVGEDARLVGDPVPIGAWHFNASTIGTPATTEFDTNNTLLASTTTIRVTGTGTIEGWGRTWLEELPAPGYLVMRKKNAPAEEVIFSYDNLTDSGGVWIDFNSMVYQSDTTADTNWAAADEWSFYALSTDLKNSLYLEERADHPRTPAATFGEIWLRNDAPNQAIFTDDAGTDAAIVQRPGIRYEYDSTTTPGTIASGEVRFNNATLTSATLAYFNFIDKDGVDLGNDGDQLSIDSGDYWHIVKEEDATQQAWFNIDDIFNASPSEAGNYYEYGIIGWDTSTSWTNPADGEVFYITRYPGVKRSLAFKETATSEVETELGATFAHIWVKSDVPNVPIFRNDAGQEYYMALQTATVAGAWDVGLTQNQWYSWVGSGPEHDTTWSGGGANLGTGTDPDLSVGTGETDQWMQGTPLAWANGALIKDVTSYFRVKNNTSSITVEGALQGIVITDGTVSPSLESRHATVTETAGTTTNGRMEILTWTINDSTIAANEHLYVCHRRTSATTEVGDPYVTTVIRYYDLIP